MSNFVKGQLVYSATWGASPNTASCIRASRHLCLAEFIKSKARKCRISSWECARCEGEIVVLAVVTANDHPALKYREEFTRKQADEALFTQRFAADTLVMVAEPVAVAAAVERCDDQDAGDRDELTGSL